MTKTNETEALNLIDLGVASTETRGAMGPEQDGVQPQQLGAVGLQND